MYFIFFSDAFFLSNSENISFIEKQLKVWAIEERCISTFLAWRWLNTGIAFNVQFMTKTGFILQLFWVTRCEIRFPHPVPTNRFPKCAVIRVAYDIIFEVLAVVFILHAEILFVLAPTPPWSAFRLDKLFIVWTFLDRNVLRLLWLERVCSSTGPLFCDFFVWFWLLLCPILAVVAALLLALDLHPIPIYQLFIPWHRFRGMFFFRDFILQNRHQRVNRRFR